MCSAIANGGTSPTPSDRSDSKSAQARHPYAWAPFGGGAHLCLGLHLADAQMRLVLGEVLRRAVLSLPAGAQPQWRHAPITHPVPGIALRLNPLT